MRALLFQQQRTESLFDASIDRFGDEDHAGRIPLIQDQATIFERSRLRTPMKEKVKR